DLQARWNRRRLELTLSGAAFLPLGSPSVAGGGVFELDVAYRIALNDRLRFQFGAGLRIARTGDGTQVGTRIPLVLGVGIHRYVEFVFGLAGGYDRILFDSPFFQDASAFSGTLEFGVRFPVHSNVAIGLSPVVLSLLGSDDVTQLVIFEPKVLTLSVAF